MAASASAVKELREISGAGMMDCKRALDEAGNDIKKAMDVLRKAGVAKAQKKAGRSASDGMVLPYIHPGSKLGVLLEVNCETDFVAKTEDFQNMVRDIAMHIAASGPIAVNKEDVAADVLESEKEIYADQARKSGKPENIIEKMIEGRISKFYQENVLMEQDFVKDPSLTINDVITDMVAKLGENIIIARFVRFQLGETAKKNQETEA
ncbi:MAG: translation elongation factor Ts [Candidatus Marinimicrobia bacterium]|jgi:elongation factor Ts|nr:translation elongation factor Ts [Candidatus Neomarinimicrobiota bacterium]MBT6871589.1 translation elongation factor Ts [Candidatus Neomarinimicrobiota bacterium]|tara:strand:+ start:10753 stop:11376 length:624 start_codon:yes stop_codon:yes gene_type:complete